MGKMRAEGDQSVIQFWLPDPDDIKRVLQLLEICGYTDKALALEEASQVNETSTMVEVTIRRPQEWNNQTWRNEVSWIEISHEGTWQA